MKNTFGTARMRYPYYHISLFKRDADIDCISISLITEQRIPIFRNLCLMSCPIIKLPPLPKISTWSEDFICSAASFKVSTFTISKFSCNVAISQLKIFWQRISGVSFFQWKHSAVYISAIFL